MTLFNRHERCYGLTLFRAFQWNVEIWVCLPGYEIKPHSHPNEHVELMYLFGRTTFYRINVNDVNNLFTESFTPCKKNIFKTFTISPGTIHWFKVSTWPLVFINFARFLDGHKPVSAAKDFIQICQEQI